MYCRAQLPTFLYPLQGAVYITKHRVLYNRVGNNVGRYILYAIPTLLMIYVGCQIFAFALHSCCPPN